VPTIAFASSKGGAGKSTAAVLLATELAVRGTTVTIIDADPNQPVTRWARKPGKPDSLTVVCDVTEETLIDAIEDAARKAAFVIVDLEGTASLMVAQAMSRADLVIIPVKGSELDAVEAIKAIKFIRRQERGYSKTIPFALLFTQTNPAVRPRTLKSIEADMLRQGIPMFSTAIHERDAYRALFSFGGTLYSLKEDLVSNIPVAAKNIRDFTAEVISMLAPAAVARKAVVA
jgi:chromosome partitioning protein